MSTGSATWRRWLANPLQQLGAIARVKQDVADMWNYDAGKT